MAYVERQRGGRHLVPMRERHEGAGWTAVCRLDCPHRGGQIGDGHIEDGKAICPLHSWDFDLRAGISPFNAVDTLPTYPVRVREGQVEVDADRVPHAPARPMVYLGEWTRRRATDRGMYLVHHLAEGVSYGALGPDTKEALARGRTDLEWVV